MSRQGRSAGFTSHTRLEPPDIRKNEGTMETNMSHTDKRDLRDGTLSS